MTLKEELLQIKTADELKTNWNKFTDLDLSDSEILQHLDKLLGPFWAPEDYHQDALEK